MLGKLLLIGGALYVFSRAKADGARTYLLFQIQHGDSPAEKKASEAGAWMLVGSVPQGESTATLKAETREVAAVNGRKILRFREHTGSPKVNAIALMGRHPKRTAGHWQLFVVFSDAGDARRAAEKVKAAPEMRGFEWRQEFFGIPESLIPYLSVPSPSVSGRPGRLAPGALELATRPCREEEAALLRLCRGATWLDTDECNAGMDELIRCWAAQRGYGRAALRSASKDRGLTRAQQRIGDPFLENLYADTVT